MAWFTRVSRFGDAHAVFGQEHDYTCGLACVIMAAFKVHKITPGSRALFSEAQILAKANANRNALGDVEKRGFNTAVILDLLNDPELGMPGWRSKQVDADMIPGEIIEKVGVTRRIGPVLSVNPVIVNIRWFSDKKKGHGLLIDTVRTVFGRTYASVCDPSDANVHIIQLNEDMPSEHYNGGIPAVGVNLWGKRPLRVFEPQIRPGTFTGTIIWRDID